MHSIVSRGRIALTAAVVFALIGLTAVRPDHADAATFSCWVQGAYLYNTNGYGHRAVCNTPTIAYVTLKRNTVPIASYSSSLNATPAPGNYVNTGVQGVPLTCGPLYQVVVTAYPLAGGPGVVWSTGAPRRVC
jgi:hypothetical protein